MLLEDSSVMQKRTTGLVAERDAFTLRLKPDLLSFVRQAAAEENRSVPNLVETILLAEMRRRSTQATPRPGSS